MYAGCIMHNYHRIYTLVTCITYMITMYVCMYTDSSPSGSKRQRYITHTMSAFAAMPLPDLTPEDALTQLKELTAGYGRS